MEDSTPWKDRVVLITGADGGQGRSHVRRLAGLGATVVATDVTKSMVAAAAETGAGMVLELDVRDPVRWDAVVAEVVDTHGRIDVLINNAGYYVREGLTKTSTTAVQDVIDVNLVGPALGIRAVVPHMPRGGVIINVASTSGLRGFAPGPVYAASKWGLRGLSRSVAREVGPLGIRVNCVVPGAIDTSMAPEEIRNPDGQFLRTNPIPRLGTPEEVTDLLVFLLSDSAAYVTGQDFVIDGGANA